MSIYIFTILTQIVTLENTLKENLRIEKVASRTQRETIAKKENNSIRHNTSRQQCNTDTQRNSQVGLDHLLLYLHKGAELNPATTKNWNSPFVKFVVNTGIWKHQLTAVPF